MADLNKIIDELSTLTVVEAAELSKQLEEKWGVTAAAPVAAAVGPTKYFSKSFFGVSLIAILVILFFVILNKIPLSLSSFLNVSSSLTFNP